MSANPQGYQIVRAAGMAVTVSAAYTRPADTTAYASGDAVANSTSSPSVLTFTDAVRYKGGSGTVMGAQLLDDSVPSTAGLFELYLFSASPTATNDNSALSISDSDALNLVGIVPFYTSKGVTAGTVYSAFALGDAHAFSFVAGSSTKNLYGLLAVRNGYTPASGGTVTIKLVISQD